MPTSNSHADVTKQVNEVHKLNHRIPSALKQTKEHQLKPSYNHLSKK